MVSIYILLDYVEEAKAKGNDITWNGLIEHKKKFWRSL